ncbi:uncharacterized protein N7515_002827 [Penicillium bovifimosum]|uniref:Zn(2)-C6 fungal-type domain-containing protein n=1 Tax=Penicillium bovifimosum TaxID=126998 RepID=A0A9W9HCY9_9EURO|nr:uncharacterized protein N7515_002827 [Penicillium bovifimosum]KAJ5144040.1 hypothetical protein N7515_002827 [Penicillium bovifimosum]
MSRPQVSIDRLTPRRATVEPRESMNCKSCRKRKIKCNRLRPSCEACKIFQSPCVYDAVPKKRGPKTDVLEALLKRVDGLEKRLHDEKKPNSPTSPDTPDESSSFPTRRNTIDTSFNIYPSNQRPTLSNIPSQQADHSARPTDHPPSILQRPSPIQPVALSDSILEIYFARLHGKPFHILDEATTRQRHQLGQLPPCLAMAISAVAIRYTSSPGPAEQSMRAGVDAALQARRMVDVDNPTLEGLQTVLLLSQAFYAYGLSKKAYMTFSNCVAMIVALDLYREAASKINIAPAEREMRRRLFWSVYLMDRFINCGSRRPCLISDHSVVLRLPSWSPHAAGLDMEGELFHVGPNIQFSADSRRKSPSATSLLIDVTRILGVTNKYLAAGGVKGDSHFPWHALSNLSKIRQELDIWAAGTQDVFASIDALFGHPESTTLLLSKLIYHLVHCLIYRPFLPIDLVELRGTGQHQSWQIEATNLCFSHANAIAELVELGRNSPLIEWPAFVCYCVCTAGTVHVHGVHYKGREGEVFSSSADFLTREMHQLAWLRNIWTGVQHQRELLQTIYTCHSELVRNLASSPMRFSPVFHLEDFLDRYPGLTLDASHVRLLDTGDDLTPGPTNFIDRQDAYYQRPTITSSYQPSYFSAARPGLSTPLPSTQSPDRRRNSHVHHKSISQSSSHQVPLSPGLQMHTIPGPHHQQSPSLPSILSLPAGTDLSFHTGFSPSAFALSPPAFHTEASLNIAPTPPLKSPIRNLPLRCRAQSQTSGTHTTAGSEGGSLEKDPFLSLLEQLAENENSQGGPSELDFFLTATGTVEGDSEIPIEKDGDV